MNIELKDIVGKWYIHFTNFPMWLKGNKKSPTFNYQIIEKKGIKKLKDMVSYTENNKEKTIKGVDTILNKKNTAFEWRGNGLLYFFKSKWEICHWEKDWFLIRFKKTLFTPSGYDVISRKGEIPEDLKIEILNTIQKEYDINDMIQIR